MSDERIDIEVTDKVDKSVSSKLRQIAEDARNGHSAVERLKAVLNDIKASPIARLAEASAKLSNALAKEMNAQVKLAKATQQTNIEDIKAEIAKQKLATATAQAAIAEQRLAAQTAKTSQAQAQATTATLAFSKAQGALNQASVAASKGMNKASIAGLDLSRQFADIGVTAAMGMNPLMIFVQQGPQIIDRLQQMKAEGVGLSAALRSMAASLGAVLVPLAPFIAVVAAAGAAFALFSRSITKNIDTKELVNSLGLTHKEIKKLKDVSIDSGDVIKATFQVLARQVGIDLTNLKKGFSDAMDALTRISKFTLSAIYANFVGTFRAINSLVEGVFSGKSFVDVLSDVGKAYKQSFDEAENALTAFGKAVEDQVKSNKLKELKAQADEIKKDRDVFDHSAEITKTNLALDNEIERLGMLRDARDVQQRFDQIQQRFAGKNSDLNEKETKTIMDKLQAIQAYQRVQSEMDNIYEEATGAQNTYSASIEAADKLLKDGRISQDAYSAAVYRAQEAYLNATDPLRAYNEQVKDQQALTGLVGKELKAMTQFMELAKVSMEGLTPLLDRQNGSLTEAGRLKLENIKADMQAFDAQQKLQELAQTVDPNAEMLANKEAYYAAIEEFRQKDLKNEEAAVRMKAALDAQYMAIRVNQYSEMFGNLATLSRSGNKTLAGIGKAAAIAQATINGYLAATRALAEGGPYMGPALAASIAAATAAQIAGIMSTNVGAFKDGGQFTVNGRDGVDKNLITMAVTKGERVTVETAKQQREADRASVSNGSNSNVSVPVKIINVLDPSEIVAAMNSAAGEQVILNTIANNRRTVNSSLQG